MSLPPPSAASSDSPDGSSASSERDPVDAVSPTWQLLFADWGRFAELAVDEYDDDPTADSVGYRFLSRGDVPVVPTSRELIPRDGGFRHVVRRTVLARQSDVPPTLDRTRVAVRLDDRWHLCAERLDLDAGLVRLTLEPGRLPFGLHSATGGDSEPSSEETEATAGSSAAGGPTGPTSSDDAATTASSDDASSDEASSSDFVSSGSAAPSGGDFGYSSGYDGGYGNGGYGGYGGYGGGY